MHFPHFQSIPGQEDLSRWFEEKMSNPEALHEEFRNRDTKLRTLIHGDLWHNNIFFKVCYRLVMIICSVIKWWIGMVVKYCISNI